MSVSSWFGRTNVSPALDRFVGRERFVQTLSDAFTSKARLVTIVGPPGVGKTRVAREFAFTARGDEGVLFNEMWFADLTTALSAEDISRTVGDCLSVERQRTESDSAFDKRLGAVLASRGQVLLVLDNLEQVTAPAGRLIGQWLETAGELSILGTSRERLNKSGETLLELGALNLPCGPVETSEQLAASEAGALFLERISSVRTNWNPSSEDAATLNEVVHLLDGLPLALELTAARMNLLGAADIKARLDERLGLLADSGLRSAIECSWVLLEPAEQAALAQCSVFPGSFDLEAAEAIIDLGSNVESVSVLDALQGLRDKSLIRFATEGGGARLSLLLSIRAFARERLEAEYVAEDIEIRHGEYFAGWCEALARSPQDVLDHFSRERENLSAVVDRSGSCSDALRARFIDLGLRAAISLRGPLTEGSAFYWPRSALVALLARAESAGASAGLVFEGRLGLSRTYRILAQHGEALKALDGAVEPQGHRGRLALERANVHSLSGNIAGFMAEWEEARPFFREAGGYRETQADTAEAVMNLSGGCPDRAARLAQSAARGHIEAGNSEMALWCRGAQAHAVLLTGRTDEASRLAKPTLDDAKERGAVRIETWAHMILSDIDAVNGRHREALRRCQAAIDLTRAGEDPTMLAEYRRVRAHLHLDVGDYKSAHDDLKAARAAISGVEATVLRAELASTESRHGAIVGDSRGARRSARQAVSLLSGGESVPLKVALAQLGAMEADLGQFDAARACFERADNIVFDIEWVNRLVAVCKGHLIAAQHGVETDNAMRAKQEAELRQLFRLIPAGYVRQDAASHGDRLEWTSVKRRLHLLASRLPEPVERLLLLDSHDPKSKALCLNPSLAWFRAPGGPIVELGDKAVMKRLLGTLVAARLDGESPRSLEQLIAALWPRERILPQAASNRCYVAITQLRKSGIGSLLTRGDQGYLLDPRVAVIEIGKKPRLAEADLWSQSLTQGVGPHGAEHRPRVDRLN